MKRLLLIICLLPVMAFGQFSGAKKLLLSQACQYGNLDNYILYWYFTNSVKCGITTYYCNTLQDTKATIDFARNCSGTITTQGLRGLLSALNVGCYVLKPDVNDDATCELLDTGNSFWGFDNSPDYPVGSTWIYHIENGVITYKERY